MHKELKIDLAPAYISFERQATDATGLKTNPSGTPTVSIYEEGGADATYDNSMIAGSPFTCAIINAKVGNYGVLVDKSLFTVGKIYRVLFEWIVDGVATAWEENFLAINASQSKADVSALAIEANVQGHAADALTGYDPPTRTEATADKDEIIADATVNTTGIVAEVDANEVKIDAVKVDTAATLVDTNEMQTKLPAAAIAGEAEATVNAAAVIAEIDDIIRYTNGKADYNIATVAVPARLVEIGMLDTIDIAISSTQVLHVELTYNSAKNVVSKDFTVV